MFNRLFKKCYLESLKTNYSLFYDDFHEYGNRDSAKYAIYFIPGINGVPGQFRLGMPALKQLFPKNDVYIKCLFLDSFSASLPVWEKYNLTNIEEKAKKIILDIAELSSQFKKIMVFVSSNGFYDFVNAYHQGLNAYAKNIILFWVACAPPRFNEGLWHPFFYKLTGFVHEGFEWAAFPNINFIKFLNKEAATEFNWKIYQQKKSLFKVDIESRFHCLNSLWFYASVPCFNACIAHAIREQKSPLEVNCYILAANRDGYWNGAKEETIRTVVAQYVKNPSIIFKNSSHLWVATPDNIYSLVSLAIKKNDLIL